MILHSISLCPYDYGGCACEKCQPYIITFAKLSRDIHALAERYFPGIEANFIGWWWAEEEHKLFAEWANREAPGWVRSIYMHIPYRETKISKAPLPLKCERRAFVHIGYAQVSPENPNDKYGHLGPVLAAERLEQTTNDLKKTGVSGYMAYSEGVFDDVNKAVLAGMSSGKFAGSTKVLHAYVQRHFTANIKTIAEWAQWLEKWDAPFDVNPSEAATMFQRLQKTAFTNNWQLHQWELKTELFRLNKLIGNGQEWTPERLALVDKFWEVQEDLYRHVWGLGPLRHIFSRKFTPLPWYKSWAAFKKKANLKNPDLEY